MLRSIFVLFASLVGAGAAVHSAFGALLFYLWFALFRPQEWLWVDITAYRPSLVIGVLLLVRSLFSGIFPNVTHPLSVGTLAFLATALVGVQGAVNPQVAWYWFDFLAKLVVVSLLLISLTSTTRRVIALLAVVSGSFGFFATKAGLTSILGGRTRFSDGLAGPFVDNNAYAVGVPMIVSEIVRRTVRPVGAGRWLVARLKLSESAA